MPDRVLGPLATPEDEAAFTRIASQAFNTDPKDIPAWLDTSRRENVRLLRRGSTVEGGLIMVPMGQFFGGRRLSMLGIAGVVVAPEHRGRGAGTQLMRATLREARATGDLLSVLYASTMPLYRGVGYESAGGIFTARVPFGRLPARSRTLLVRPVAESDDAGVEALYHQRARRTNGFADRGEYLWRRVRNPYREKSCHGFVVEDDRGLAGYAYLAQRTGGEWIDLHVVDWSARTAEATERILGLAADHFSMGGHCSWNSGPADPFLLSLPERGYTLTQTEPWLLRLLDVRRALAARGYASGVGGLLELEVHDALFPENGGRMVLEVADGDGTVREGGEGRLRADVRGLAPLFTGYLPAEELALAGHLTGSDEQLATATRIFTGTPPILGDRF